MRKATWMATLVAAGLVLATGGAQAQTDVALSLYGNFNPSVSGSNGVVSTTVQSPANQAGGLLEVRHIHSALVGYEATYAYNRDNQGYMRVQTACPVAATTASCSVSWAAVSANAHEITGDWIVSLRGPVLRPFALAGGGVLLNVPTAGTITTTGCNPLLGGVCTTTTTAASTSTSTKGVFVYGAGVDWTVLPHIGLRLQYRGNLYKAAGMVNAFSSTNAFTHSAQPMIGVFFRM